MREPTSERSKTKFFNRETAWSSFSRLEELTTEDKRLAGGGGADIFGLYDGKDGNTYIIRKSKITNQSLPEVDLYRALNNNPNSNRGLAVPTHFYDNGERSYAVIPYYDRGSLQEVLRESNLSLQERITILNSLLIGIHTIHQNGFIHGDIKPSNVLIDSRDGAVLSDFDASYPRKPNPDQQLEIRQTSEYLDLLLFLNTEHSANYIKSRYRDLYSFALLIYGTFSQNTGLMNFPSERARFMSAAYTKYCEDLKRGKQRVHLTQITNYAKSFSSDYIPLGNSSAVGVDEKKLGTSDILSKLDSVLEQIFALSGKPEALDDTVIDRMFKILQDTFDVLLQPTAEEAAA